MKSKMHGTKHTLNWHILNRHFRVESFSSRNVCPTRIKLIMRSMKAQRYGVAWGRSYIIHCNTFRIEMGRGSKWSETHEHVQSSHGSSSRHEDMRLAVSSIIQDEAISSWVEYGMDTSALTQKLSRCTGVRRMPYGNVKTINQIIIAEIQSTDDFA